MTFPLYVPVNSNTLDANATTTMILAIFIILALALIKRRIDMLASRLGE